jgi:hypothetical protein
MAFPLSSPKSDEFDEFENWWAEYPDESEHPWVAEPEHPLVAEPESQIPSQPVGLGMPFNPRLYSYTPREDSVEMAIFRFVVNYVHIDNREFIESLYWASTCHEIIDSKDFLEFMVWWFSRNDFRNNIMKDSAFGVIQQFQGVLSPEESDYIDGRSASWYGGISLRLFLRHVTERFPPRHITERGPYQ